MPRLLLTCALVAATALAPAAPARAAAPAPAVLARIAAQIDPGPGPQLRTLLPPGFQSRANVSGIVAAFDDLSFYEALSAAVEAETAALESPAALEAAYAALAAVPPAVAGAAPSKFSSVMRSDESGHWSLGGEGTPIKPDVILAAADRLALHLAATLLRAPDKYDTTPVLTHLARRESRLGNYGAAAKYQALLADGAGAADPAAWLQLGEYHLLARELSAARAAFAGARKRLPDGAGATRTTLGRYERALDALAKLSADGGPQTLESTLGAATVLFEAGLTELGRGVLREAMARAPADARPGVALARSYEGAERLTGLRLLLAQAEKDHRPADYGERLLGVWNAVLLASLLRERDTALVAELESAWPTIFREMALVDPARAEAARLTFQARRACLSGAAAPQLYKQASDYLAKYPANKEAARAVFASVQGEPPQGDLKPFATALAALASDDVAYAIGLGNYLVVAALRADTAALEGIARSIATVAPDARSPELWALLGDVNAVLVRLGRIERTLDALAAYATATAKNPELRTVVNYAAVLVEAGQPLRARALLISRPAAERREAHAALADVAIARSLGEGGVRDMLLAILNDPDAPYALRSEVRERLDSPSFRWSRETAGLRGQGILAGGSCRFQSVYGGGTEAQAYLGPAHALWLLPREAK
jgi:hypothetical protein